MKDLKLVNGDIVIESVNGSKELILISDYAECVAQDLECALNFFLGEWFLDTREGLPVFRVVFVKNPNISAVSSMFSRAILKRPGVAKLDFFQTDYDRAKRTIQILFRAILKDGSTVDRSNDPFIIEVL